MKKFNYFAVFVIILVSMLNNVHSQDDKPKFKMPEGSGTISGIVVDKDSHAPLEGAVITLFKAKDSLRVKGAGTDNSGAFKMEAPYGMYKIEVSYVGYSIAVVSKVAVFPKKPDVV